MDEIYSVIKSFIYLMALPAFVLGKNVRFRVTPKDSKKTIALQGIMGPAIIFGFNLAAIITVISNPYTMALLGIFGWIVFCWCIYMAGISFSACLYCFKPLIKKSNIPVEYVETGGSHVSLSKDNHKYLFEFFSRIGFRQE